jgi:hypothetical protein
MPRAALLTLFLVLGVEVGLHLMADRLPDPVLWGSGEVSTKVAQALKLGAEGQAPIDVLILGPSHPSMGISPTLMREAASRPDWKIYNGALNGRDYPVVSVVMERIYLPELKPKLLLLTATPITTNSRYQALGKNTKEFFDAPKPKSIFGTGLQGAWARFLVNHVYLYRYHTRSKGLADGWIAGAPKLDATGFHSLSGTFNAEEKRLLLKPNHPYRDIWTDYEFGGPSVDAFREILDAARRHDLPVLVINMPFLDELYDLPGNGRASYAVYLEKMSALLAEFDAPWIDYNEIMELDETDFHDVDHLNLQGVEKLSALLARDVERLFPDPG